MTCCPHCTDAETLFSRRTARRELRRYQRKGATSSTRLLLDMLDEEDAAGRDLIDIGGGIGAIQHEMLRKGLRSAVHVDASRAYLDASMEEAGRQGHADRVEYVHGDFAYLDGHIEPADIVTLDRVVCCYPDMRALIRQSAAKARAFIGLSYPRVNPISRATSAVGNLYFRLRGSAFRTYLHAPAAMDAELMGQGFSALRRDRTVVWHVALYRRTTAAPS